MRFTTSTTVGQTGSLASDLRILRKTRASYFAELTGCQLIWKARGPTCVCQSIRHLQPSTSLTIHDCSPGCQAQLLMTALHRLKAPASTRCQGLPFESGIRMFARL